MASSTISEGTELEQLCINTIRTLSMDAVQRANSGHPGTPMALAPLAYALWTRHLRHNPGDPNWIDRDRFVLSAGHASMLIYSLLYLTGYDLSLDDLKNFRQWHSRTPGHPEYGMTPGVETTTGPLGQGLANAVGMAMAEARLSELYGGSEGVIDHYTYVICSDGDLMEGVASEAASIAGHLELGKLICFWDDNSITIEGSTDLAFTEDVLGRFDAYGWQTLEIADGNDLEAVDAAIEKAKADPRPTMIGVKTVIGYGSPNKAGTASAHGSPLGAEEIERTKKALGWEWMEPFHVPAEALEHMREQLARGGQLQAEWKKRWNAFQSDSPDKAAALQAALDRTLPGGWADDVPTFAPGDKAIATRAASGKVLNAIANRVPWIVGGSADLAGSNNTELEGDGDWTAANPTGRNLHFGVREHGMGAVMNGMALHGGVRPYGGTFLIFSDYMRPPIRLAALMQQPTIYVFTHDSVGLGEDGPTHQPIEQLAALRAIPGLVDLRPCDAAETAELWKWVMEYRDGPAFFALTRQAVPHLDHEKYAPAQGARKGAYVLAEAGSGTPELILIASGSEVSLALDARERLEAEGIATRVVSMPSWQLFGRQDAEYRESILPRDVRARVSVEAAGPMGWHRWVGEEGAMIAITHFGESAPAEEIFEQLGFTADNIVAQAKSVLGKGSAEGDQSGLDAAGPAKLGVDEK